MTRAKRTLAIGVCVTGLSLPGSGWAGGGAAEVLFAGASPGSEAERVGAEPAERVTPASHSQTSTAARSAVTPVFVPRARRGSPAARVGGATRGRTGELVVSALVPRLDESAVALAEDQTLYWHLSSRTEHAINFTVTDRGAIDPLLDVTLNGPFEEGFHALDLAAHAVRLEASRRYEWYVAVVPDPARRSADIIARGAIERVEEPSLHSRLGGLALDQAAGLLAEQGIWYDTLDALTRQIAARPRDPALLAQRTALLRQVGLELPGDAD